MTTTNQCRVCQEPLNQADPRLDYAGESSRGLCGDCLDYVQFLADLRQIEPEDAEEQLARKLKARAK